jgi:hypothetical protein
MAFIKSVGYFLVSALVLAVFFASGIIATAIAGVIGLFFAIAVVIAFVAFCIKDYCESEPTDPSRGNKEGEPQGKT